MEEFKRREFKIGDSIRLESNVRTWRIYDCPTDLISKYISYAKLYFDNKVWRVLEKGMQLMLQEETQWKVVVDTRLDNLEKKVFAEKPEPVRPATFAD